MGMPLSLMAVATSKWFNKSIADTAEDFFTSHQSQPHPSEPSCTATQHPVGREFETELCGERGRLQITSFVRDSMVVGQASETAASQFSRWLLRVEAAVDPGEIAICARFGEFPKAKPRVCVFSPSKDSAIHLISIIYPILLKLAIVHSQKRSSDCKKQKQKYVLRKLHGAEWTKHSHYIILCDDYLVDYPPANTLGVARMHLFLS